MYSWTNREYQNFLKGAHLNEIDELEKFSIGAMFNARANNEKRVNTKKLFNAEKLRKKIMSKKDGEKQVYTKEQTAALRQWFNNYSK